MKFWQPSSVVSSTIQQFTFLLGKVSWIRVYSFSLLPSLGYVEKEGFNWVNGCLLPHAWSISKRDGGVEDTERGEAAEGAPI